MCVSVSHVLQDSTLAHWGNKQNLFTEGIKTLEQLRRLQKRDTEVSAGLGNAKR
jgi:hypothetical protein